MKPTIAKKIAAIKDKTIPIAVKPKPGPPYANKVPGAEINITNTIITFRLWIL